MYMNDKNKKNRFNEKFWLIFAELFVKNTVYSGNLRIRAAYSNNSSFNQNHGKPVLTASNYTKLC